MSYKKAVKQKFKKSWCMDMSTNTEKRYWIMDGVLHETLPVGYFPTKITNPIGKFLSEGKTPAKAWEAAAKLVFSSTEP